MSANLHDTLEDGDQVQLFQGDYDPATGAPRELMVVFGRREKIKYAGPIDQAVLEDPRVVVRNIKLHIPLSLINNFTPSRSPLLGKKRASGRGRVGVGAQA